MKPVDESRLADTLDRVRQRLGEKQSVGEAAMLKDALAEHAPEAAADLAADGGSAAAAISVQPLREAHQHQGPGPDLPRRRRHDRADRGGGRLHGASRPATTRWSCARR